MSPATGAPAAGPRLKMLLLQNTSIVMLVIVIVFFAALSPRFLTVPNFVNILVQSAHVAIVAIGMTLVLLLAGIDLSVGANMYVCAAVLGLFLKGVPLYLSLPMTMATGLAFGAINALIISRLRVPAFITTLAMQFVGRGAALYFSGSRMVIFDPGIPRFGRSSFIGVPSSIWIFAVVLVVAHVMLRHTQFGRQIYAVGADADAATKAGINVKRIQFAVYCLCGVCAAIGGIVELSQVAAASAAFGDQEEFTVIAAAVLGGVSLFGGRGSVLGAVFGAVLIHTVESGLVMIDADPYVYPLVISVIIFVAVLVDSLRTRMIERLERRHIRVETDDRPALAGTG